MATHTWKTGLATLLIAFGCAGIARASDLDRPEPVPVVLVDATDPAATPDPICGVCTIVIKPESQGDRTTTVTINHDGDFTGDVELVVWLDSDERESVWIPAVTIDDGGAVEIEVEAGEGWDWDDVQFAWTHLYRE
jgi:hypothetical protein